MSLIIVFNNYFHDLATGVFFGCALTLWAVSRSVSADPARATALLPIYRSLTRALWVSVGWILIGGVPRTVYFPDYEFVPALGKGIIPALIVKHVVMFAAVSLGVAAWAVARREFSKYRPSPPASS